MSRSPFPRSGFTLVELIVSVALVLIIMLLLAQVFDVAASTARKQRGTAENDEQARTFTILVKQDLENRSMVRMVPFYPRTGTTTPYDPDRSGYFYYSENDPGNQTEDVLAFTVTLPDTLQPYHGSARVLVDPNVGSNVIDDDQDGTVDDPDESDPANYLRFFPNQPEGDDGIAFTAAPGNSNSDATDINGNLNGIGMSRSAEIVYFLRGGNLYRRVLLIRQPYDETPPSPPLGSFPNNIMQGNYSTTYSPLGSGAFYRDFDYSAYHFLDNDGMGNQIPEGPRFNTIANLNNTAGPENLDIYSVPTSLGTPHRRFGHNPFSLLGRPKEFVLSADGTLEDANGNGWLDPGEDNGNGKLDDEFIGRFLSQETAILEDINGNGLLDPGEDLNGNGVLDFFGYPGIATTGGSNPFARTNLRLNPTTRLVNAYSGGYDRRGEDILMTNVIEFDVKLFDDGLPTPGYVDLGHSLRESDYVAPGTTWTAMGNGDLNSNGTNDPVGHYNILRNLSYDDANADGILNATYDAATKRYVLTESLNYGNRYDTWCSRTITDNSNIGTAEYVVPPPYRPYGPGPDGVPGNPGDDDGVNGPEDPGELGYPGSDETAGPPYLYQYPLRGIQISVKFMDPSNDLIRQVTIIQSFVDPTEF